MNQHIRPLTFHTPVEFAPEVGELVRLEMVYRVQSESVHGEHRTVALAPFHMLKCEPDHE